MRIAYILPAFPDQHKAPSGYLRPYHFIRELSHSHSVTIFSLASDDISSEARTEMAHWTQQVFIFSTSAVDKGGTVTNAKPGGRILRAWRSRQAVERMQRSFEELASLDSYDVVLFHGKQTFPVIARCELPMVIDFCDATSYRIRQGMRYAALARLPLQFCRYLETRYFEKKLMRKSGHRVFISARDRSAMLGPFDRSPIVPNGIDLAYWTRRTSRPQPHSIVYSGVMEYPPNADGAFYLINKILPLVRRSVADVKLFIVGRKPSARLVRDARASPGVTVTGFVKDVRPYLELASVYVAPLRFASGMQNKLLEAMAMEVPVVTTPIGAQGIKVEGVSDVPVSIAHGEVQIARAIIDVFGDPEQKLRMAAAARNYVERHFDWSRSAAQLEQVCMDAIYGEKADRLIN